MPTKSYTSRIYHQVNALYNIATPTDERPVNWFLNSEHSDIGGTRTDGGPVADYARKIARGDDANSLLSGVKTSLEWTPGDYFLKSKFLANGTITWSRFFGDVALSENPVNYSPFLNSTALSATDGAKTDFVKRALQAQSALQGQVFLGEIREALQMIKRPAQGLRRGIDDYYEALRRRRKGSKTHKRRVLAETWLEYQFGWAPLISDIESGAEALANIAHRRLPFKMVRAKATRSYMGSTEIVPLAVNGAFNALVNKKRTATVTKVIRGVVNLHVQDPRLMAQQNLGFRWDLFVPTLWELTPYSFLIDYFTNIGDVLTNWSFATSNLRWCWMTSITETLLESQSTIATFSPSGSGYERQVLANSPGSSRTTWRIIDRSPLSSLVPSIRLEIPGMASLKWLNIAALGAARRSMRPY